MNIFNRIFTGIGIGSFVYLISIFLKNGVFVTSKSIIFVFMISIFVGIATIIFDSEKLSFGIALFIHYICSTLFILVVNYFFWGISGLIDFLSSMTVIYIFSYCITQIKLKLTIKELNKYIKELDKQK